MAKEYGYLGETTVDAQRLPTLTASGEAVYTPYAENAWAKELVSSDGKYRFMKAASAIGRGAGNMLDTVLADNFTVMCLCRPENNTSYATVVSKGTYGTNEWFGLTPTGSAASGPMFHVKHGAGANPQAAAPGNTRKPGNWQWIVGQRNGTGLTVWGDGKKTAGVDATGGSISNNNNLQISATGFKVNVACVLVFGRVLSDQEVTALMAGSVNPKNVPGLVGYYKFNEISGMQCIDYSGLSSPNHLTYTLAIETANEVYDPQSSAVSNFRSGQPYPARAKRSQLDWWNRMPGPIYNQAAQGSAIANSPAPRLTMPAAFALDGSDFTFCIKAKLNPSSLHSLSLGYNATYSGVSIFINNMNNFRILWGDGAGFATTSFPLIAKPLPSNTWLDVQVLRSGSFIGVYINNVLVTSVSGMVQPYITAAAGLFYPTLSSSGASRSSRWFNRALSAAERESIFVYDTCRDRSGLLGEWMSNDMNSVRPLDTSGNGNHTTSGACRMVLDSPYYVPRRKRTGSQLTLKGITGSVLHTSSALRSLVVGARYLTVACWIKPDAGYLSSSQQVGIQTSVPNAGLTIGGTTVTGRRYSAYIRSGTSDSAQSIASQINSVQPGVYQLVAIDVDYTAKTASIYVNGVLSSKATGLAFANNVYTDVGNPGVSIMNAQAGSSTVYDDIRVYNRQLTSDEHYSLYLGKAPAGKIVEYTFDADDSLVRDSSGNGFHATPSGGPTYVKQQ